MHTRSLPAKAGNDGYAGTFQPTKKKGEMTSEDD